MSKNSGDGGAVAPTLPRKAAIRAENESLIIGAAEQLFAKFGYRGTSISVVAEAAGVPKANVYHYFASKEALYQRVLERTHIWWGSAALVFETEDDPVEALSAYVNRKMDMSRENYFGSKVWASEVIQGAPMLQGYLENEVRGWTRLQMARIERWIAEGKILPIAPLPFLMMIWATTQWYADFEHQITALNGGRGLTDDEFEAAKVTVREIVLRGIGAKPS